MGSRRKSSKTPSTAKARSKKRHRRILQITVPGQVRDESSIFDDMTDMERVLAFSYYYDHPDELPDRESGAARRAKERPAKIRVKFDEAIFERKTCARPIPDDDLVEVDPLTPPTSPPETPLSDKVELFSETSPHHFWTTGIVHCSQEAEQKQSQEVSKAVHGFEAILTDFRTTCKCVQFDESNTKRQMSIINESRLVRIIKRYVASISESVRGSWRVSE